METAAKVLIVGGMLNLSYGAITGVIISRIRSASPETPRFLTMAHVGPLMQGPMLLALVIAVGFSTLAEGLETTAAWLLVAGSFGIAAGDTLHWVGDVKDPFAERPIGFYGQAIGGILTAAGIFILLIGVFRGL